jgi:hypothetical protein
VRSPLLAALLLIACSSSAAEDAEIVQPAGEEAAQSEANVSEASPAAPGSEAAAPAPDPSCPSEITVAATESGEHALVVEAASFADTSWAEKGNEAVIATVKRGAALVGHLVLHQGRERFAYAMHTGAVSAGEAVTIAAPGACITSAKLTRDDSEGVANAPVLKWPKQKSFDDLPVVAGWSKRGKSYQIAYTHENGGTVAICGGGAKGVRSEIARWGRAFDIEGAYSYGSGPRFERCTGSATPRMEAKHPILYYGDGHNRLFESRAGYGQACGSDSDKRADGNLDGWNANNPGNEIEKDDPFTIVLRPLPVELDAVPGRESIADRYAPWLYRLTWNELAREGRIDGQQTFALDHYLFVDVYAADVGGKGDSTCQNILETVTGGVDGGFVLRAITKSGVVSNGPQMTADYFGGTLKRIAIPLAPGVKPADISKMTFDAYDGDGIYWLALGDAFVAKPSGRNGATLEHVNKGKRAVNVYVDDDESSCVGGKNTREGVAYPCAGTAHTLTL